MMGKQSGQQEVNIIDVEIMISSDHLLRKIAAMVSFEITYDAVHVYYAAKGRPSIDPIALILCYAQEAA